MIRTARLAMVTALAGTLLTGCGTLGQPPRAEASASKAQAALADGKPAAAIRNAETAVAADPHNAAWRAMLASAYLQSGRFASAAATFDDAIVLGDTSPRTALSLALALIGQGQTRAAAELLNDREDDIASADLGLALALAGQPDRAIHVLGNAIRNGENTPRMRQNIAYAYALAGRWREARLMAAQDVPADQLGDRIQEWAEMSQPQSWQLRVARLLGAPAGVADGGQPARLALTSQPAHEQLAVEAATRAHPAPSAPAPSAPASSAPASSAPAPAVDLAAATGELPAISPAPSAPIRVQEPAVARADDRQPARATRFEAAFAPVAAESGTVSAAAQKQPLRQPVKPAGSVGQSVQGSHMVQLGSFSSASGARRAKDIYLRNHPELTGHRMVISQATVNGRAYWRVAAAGFNRADSSAMCGKVKARGQACIAHAMAQPLPGGAMAATQLARR